MSKYYDDVYFKVKLAMIKIVVLVCVQKFIHKNVHLATPKLMSYVAFTFIPCVCFFVQFFKHFLIKELNSTELKIKYKF